MKESSYVGLGNIESVITNRTKSYLVLYILKHMLLNH